MLDDQIILGFETSCDETAIAILKGDELLVNTISSQVDIHEKLTLKSQISSIKLPLSYEEIVRCKRATI